MKTKAQKVIDSCRNDYTTTNQITSMLNKEVLSELTRDIIQSAFKHPIERQAIAENNVRKCVNAQLASCQKQLDGGKK